MLLHERVAGGQIRHRVTGRGGLVGGGRGRELASANSGRTPDPCAEDPGPMRPRIGGMRGSESPVLVSSRIHRVQSQIQPDVLVQPEAEFGLGPTNRLSAWRFSPTAIRPPPRRSAAER